MKVSLEEAIAIHARVLKYRAGHKAPVLARNYAERCGKIGDHEGVAVWRRVEEAAEHLLGQEAQPLIADPRLVPNLP